MSENPVLEAEIIDVADLKDQDNTELPAAMTPAERINTTTISYSKLRLITVNGAKSYYERYVLKERSAMTDNQIFGIAAHKELLEPDSFLEDFIVTRKLDRRKTADKAEYERLVKQATEEKKFIIQEPVLERVKAIAEAVRTHPNAGPILKDALTEVEMRWQKQARCKTLQQGESEEHSTTFNTVAYVDIINPKLRLIADLKVVDGVFEPYKFRNKAKKEFYHGQAALYLEGADENGIDANNFRFILASAKKPYDVAVLTPNEEFLDHGDEAQQAALNKLYRTLLTENWVSYPDEIELDYVRW